MGIEIDHPGAPLAQAAPPQRTVRREAAWLAGFIAVVAGWSFGGPEFHASVLATIAIYALLGLSLVVLALSGQVSLGHAAFMGLGAYASALLVLRAGLPPWLGLVLSMLVPAVAALVIGLATAGLRGHFLALATLAWGIALAACFRAAGAITGGASGLGGIPPLELAGHALSAPRPMAVLAWGVVVVAAAAVLRVQRSRVGRGLSALRQQEVMAAGFGVPVERMRLGALVASAVLAGLAGGLYAHFLGFISPSPFDLGGSIKGLMIAVVGGELSALGALAGTFFVEGLNWLLQAVLPRVSDAAASLEPLFYGLVLIAVMLFFPDGLWQRVDAWFAGRRGGLPPAAPLAPQASPAPSAEPLLQVEGIGVDFGGVRALDDVRFDVRRGEVLGLIGPNGAGKSTAFDVVSGVNRRHRGRVLVGGHPVPAEGTSLLARSFQHTRLMEERSVLDNVMLGAWRRSRHGWLQAVLGLDRGAEAAVVATARECLDQVGLLAHAGRMAGTLSLGERRLVEVARALAADPAVLLLDEPAAGLRKADRARLAALVQQLNGQGRTVVLVEHDVELVMACARRIVVLDRGRVIADGPPAAVRRDPAVVEAYLGGADAC